MNDPFADERIQFYLRNRADIKAWAAIEPDVIAATRELLARAQPQVEESLLAHDPNVSVGRRDVGQWERILARHERWPDSVGLALEWHRTVDPLSNPPKLGVFWWADPPSLVDPRTRFIDSVDRTGLQRLGYKVPLEGVWPVGARLSATPDWWRDPHGWVGGLVERLTSTWPLVAAYVDRALEDGPAV
jgi:hypothetical protein